MMWVLQSERGERYFIAPENVHCVSRKEGDLLLPDDQSISRKHAYFQVKPDGTEVIVWDDGSKYGTFVNDGIQEGVRIEQGIKTSLKPGDSVRFGLQWNTWRILNEQVVVCSSTLTDEEKIELAKVLKRLGGILTEKWNSTCTHLTMSKITLTVKVVCALACARPVVTPSFWRHFHEAMVKRSPPPKPSDFVPPLAEDLLNREGASFLPNSLRSSLFKDKIFIFPTAKIHQKLRPMVDFAGGRTCELLSCGLKQDDFFKPHVIVVSHSVEEKDQSVQFKSLARALREKGLRVVPESEIGLAVLSKSLNTYCNPAHNPRKLLVAQSPCVTPRRESNITIVPDTEDLNSGHLMSQGMTQKLSQLKPNIAIPPSGTSIKSGTDVSHSTGVIRSCKNATADTSDTSMKNDTHTPSLPSTRKRLRDNALTECSAPKKTPLVETSDFPATSKNESGETVIPENSNSGSSDVHNGFAFREASRGEQTSGLRKQALHNTESPADDFSFLDGSHGKGKKKKIPLSAKDDDFFLPSPKKLCNSSRELKETFNGSSGEMFYLEPPPPSSAAKSDPNKDIFGLDVSKKKSPRSLSLNKSTKIVDNLNESVDLFGDMDDLTQVREREQEESAHLNAKRKSRTDDESSAYLEPCPKRKLLESQQMVFKSKEGISLNGFLSKNSALCIKTEVKDESTDNMHDVSSAFNSKMVIVDDSVVIKKVPTMHREPVCNSTSATCGKNYKKFVKVWKRTTGDRKLLEENLKEECIGVPDLFTSFQRNEEEVDNPHVPHHQRNTKTPNDTQDDEWAFVAPPTS